MSMGYAYYSEPVAHAAASERARFIRLTYLHVGAALLAFVGILAALFRFVPDETLRNLFVGRSSAPLLFLAGFIIVGMASDYLALNARSRTLQYVGLTLGVLLEAVFVFPLLYYANNVLHAPDLIQSAAVMSIFAFGGLTVAAFATGKDFSFLRTIIVVGGFAMLGLVVAAILFPASIQLGIWFSLLGVGLACIMILYQTSNVMHHYRTDQYVGASLALFSSLATLFYYILRVLIEANRSR